MLSEARLSIHVCIRFSTTPVENLREDGINPVNSDFIRKIDQECQKVPFHYSSFEVKAWDIDFINICSCQNKQITDKIKRFNSLSKCHHKQHDIDQSQHKL